MSSGAVQEQNAADGAARQLFIYYVLPRALAAVLRVCPGPSPQANPEPEEQPSGDQSPPPPAKNTPPNIENSPVWYSLIYWQYFIPGGGGALNPKA